MRQKRAKAYKKQMSTYVHTFKFREPYQTIVDDELVTTCVKSSFDLVKGLNRTIQAETKPMITQCCMQALYKTDNQPAIELAKTFERRRCNHQPSDPATPIDCIDSISNVGGVNKHRYIVATQHYELRKKLRRVPGVPLIFMNRSVMVMEPLSDATTQFANKVESSKLTAGLNDAKNAGYINHPETPSQDQPAEGQPPKKKSKGPKGPNPLSVKKKKPENSKSNDPANTNSDTKKRRRRHHKSQSEATHNDTENTQDPPQKPNPSENIAESSEDKPVDKSE